MEEPPEEDPAEAAMRRRIRELEADPSLSAAEKAVKRQAILAEPYSRGSKGKAAASEAAAEAAAKGAVLTTSFHAL